MIFQRRYYGVGVNTFFARSDFCHLLITFANTLDPEPGYDRKSVLIWIQNVDTSIVFLKEFFEKIN